MKCFFHKADLDGVCSAAIVKLKHKDCELIGVDYGEPFPWDSIEYDETVYMVDFALQPFEQMLKLKGLCNLNWIDHHASAISEYDKLESVLAEGAIHRYENDLMSIKEKEKMLHRKGVPESYRKKIRKELLIK